MTHSKFKETNLEIPKGRKEGRGEKKRKGKGKEAVEEGEGQEEGRGLIKLTTFLRKYNSPKLNPVEIYKFKFQFS